VIDPRFAAARGARRILVELEIHCVTRIVVFSAATA